MIPFRAAGVRAFVGLAMLAGVGCASSREGTTSTRFLPLREPAQSVSHPPQRLAIPPSVAIPMLLQAKNSTPNPIEVE
jgi:hypothetical protein